MKLLLATFLLLLTLAPAWARDNGQWENEDPAIKRWYEHLMQPDVFPPRSCCGSGDAYWADEYYVENSKIIAVITDDRDDVPLLRAHVPIGTKYVVPNSKLIGAKKEGNPTGHSVIFLGTVDWLSDGTQAKRFVLCFALGTGI